MIIHTCTAALIYGTENSFKSLPLELGYTYYPPVPPRRDSPGLGAVVDIRTASSNGEGVFPLLIRLPGFIELLEEEIREMHKCDLPRALRL